MAFTQMEVTAAPVSASLRSYFNKKLLEYAIPNRKWAEDALQAKLPPNMGTNSTVSWWRWPSPTTASVVTLTEGTPLTASKTMTLTQVSATLSQYGEVIKVTDLLSAQDLFDTLDQGVKTLGEDAALKLDYVVRNAAIFDTGASANQVFCGINTAVSTIGTTTTQTGAIIRHQDLLEAATNLKVDNAPQFGGYYHCILDPLACYDLMATTGGGSFVDVNKYTTNTPILDGEIGRLYGVRIKESTLPRARSLTGAPYTEVATGHVTMSAVYGQNAYGSCDLASQSPYAPSIQIVNTPDSANALNQFTLIGWKSFFAAKQLNGTFVAPLIHTVSLG